MKTKAINNQSWTPQVLIDVSKFIGGFLAKRTRREKQFTFAVIAAAMVAALKRYSDGQLRNERKEKTKKEIEG